ncbi:VapB protein of antitoxin of type II toxin-antitoxin system [Murinocardiopsis flavida]|uniref:VapB protein of antitoxin of type II toxin-antitoxin system n=1 Tax=Murinocardiopsis flavida TaxID=645275 RepID=A0A2P8DTZ8_9ACTN|nr:type II toxin-antitoxin system VapB family antitoxin [Murinocardiopsis flavida]PSL00689.1 VapB protein of antitoxin of type II toxin-antitoxin system [Murinocardiopsis flavida]
MTKVLIDIDDDALASAAEVYGTTTKKDTVNTALREASRRVDRARALVEMQALADEGGFDVELLQDKRNYRG